MQNSKICHLKSKNETHSNITELQESIIVSDKCQEFYCNVIKDLSHPMYGDTHKWVIDKFNDEKDRFSFIIMIGKGSVIDGDNCECYGYDYEFDIIQGLIK